MSSQTLAAPRRDRSSPLTEQRKARRHTYTCRQLIAPFDGTRMPEQEEFSWAMFRDVSQSGVSFLTKRRPAAQQFIVAVGPAPFSFLIVEVVHTKRRNDLPGHPFHVGCTIVRELVE